MDFSSSLRQCPRGHWYDGSISGSCPQCAAENRVQEVEDYGATEAITPKTFSGMMPPAGMGSAMGAGSNAGAARSASFVEDYGPTEPVRTPGFEKPASETGRDGGSREPAARTGGSSAVEDFGPTMPAENRRSQSFSPVTGWLVCIEGPDRGRDYRVRAGYNRIGRSESMDICIPGDPSISRERHAVIAYDPEERVFFFSPDEGKNLVRLNGKLLMGPGELHAYDAVTLGATKLLFVPLCGERFSWDE